MNALNLIPALVSGEISVDEVEVSSLIEILQAADDNYYNDGGGLLSDSMYDNIRKYSEKVDPYSQYFTGVGSDVRGGKVKLPYQMGSLNQAYEGDLTKWVEKHHLTNDNITISDKLDGVSALLVYDDNGDIQIAFSRGNGVEGADITRHLSKITNVPQKVSGKMVVRGEVIIRKADFEPINRQMTRGTTYKNLRNMVSGMMNSSENEEIAYFYLKFVAYQVIVPTLPSKIDQFITLKSEGFEVVQFDTVLGWHLNDEQLIRHLNTQRNNSLYEIDGVVLEVDNEEKRRMINPSRDTLNPEYARKFKVASEDNTAVVNVVGIHWKLSKDGYLKPRVEIEPVDLVGVTITYASGFNAKFILENKLGPGAKIRITRSGDVIPYIQEVIESANVSDYCQWFDSVIDLAIGSTEWAWTESNVDITFTGYHIDSAIEQAKSFFSTLEVMHLGEGNIIKLFVAGYDSPLKIVKAPEFDLYAVLGENGKKIYNSIKTKLTNIPEYVLMDASGTLGRGVGTRKLKKLYEGVQGDMTKFFNSDIICSTEGFDTKTADVIVSGKDAWFDFIEEIKDYVTIKPYEEQKVINGSMTGQVFVFTGVRDKKLEEVLVSKGAEIAGSINKKTTCVVAKDRNARSSKLEKAREIGINIVSLTDAWNMV